MFKSLPIADVIVLVLGGSHELYSDVEIIDISPEEGICSDPADFPYGKDLAKGAVGGYIDGMALVCGGIESGRDCHGYEFETQSWSKMSYRLGEWREEAAGIVIGNR